MRVIFIGTGDFGVPALRWLHESQHELAGLVCQPDRPAGRGKRLLAPATKRLAQPWGIPILQPADVNEPAHTDAILALDANLGVVAAFGQKLGPRLLEEIPLGCINLHASLLPRWRGAAPINWAITAGDAKTGVTVFQLAEKMDVGKILHTVQTPIGPLETAEELHDRLAELGVEALQAAMGLYGDPLSRPPGHAQDPDLVTRAPKLRKEDGRLDFARPAAELARQIRGLWSWPGGQCVFCSIASNRREQVILARARVADEPTPADARPGEILAGGRVVTGEGLLEVLEVKPAGGRLMSWQDFANGRRIAQGDRFDNG